jgi:CRP-like cAMP-binding protein
VLDYRQLDNLFSNKAMARRLAVAQAEQTRRLTSRLAVRAALDAPQNLAYFILELFAALKVREMTQGLRFQLPLSTREVADALGLTTVHLHRVLRALRSEGLLSLERGWAEITDYERLLQFAELHPADPAAALC